MSKIGETLDKIGKPGNFEDVHFFPVSAPGDNTRKVRAEINVNIEKMCRNCGHVI